MNLVNYDKNTIIVLFEDYVRTHGNVSIEEYLDESGIVTDVAKLKKGDIVSDKEGHIFSFAYFEAIFEIIVAYGINMETGKEEVLPVPIYQKRKEPELTLCVTGPRPASIGWGYDYDSAEWQGLKQIFREKLIALLADYESLVCWDGMALGTDTVFAETVLELREQGLPLKLCCAIPCRTQASKWKEDSRRVYDEILSKADVVNYLQDAYSPSCLNERNKFMVNRSSLVIALWNGSAGGTGNCVAYADTKGVKVDLIHPESVKKEKAE